MKIFETNFLELEMKMRPENKKNFNSKVSGLITKLDHSMKNDCSFMPSKHSTDQSFRNIFSVCIILLSLLCIRVESEKIETSQAKREEFH